MSKSDKVPGKTDGNTDKARRDFLRKSMYAAYATPVITALLVNNASASKSWNSGNGVDPTDPTSPDSDD